MNKFTRYFIASILLASPLAKASPKESARKPASENAESVSYNCVIRQKDAKDHLYVDAVDAASAEGAIQLVAIRREMGKYAGNSSLKDFINHKGSFSIFCSNPN